MLTVTHLINILPSPNLNYKSLYELLFQNKPKYNYLRTFGCMCYMSNLSPSYDIFGAKSIQCIFLGYAFHKKDYRVMTQTRKCYTTKDVKFVVDTFLFKTPVSSQFQTSIPFFSYLVTSYIFPDSPLHITDSSVISLPSTLESQNKNSQTITTNTARNNQ